ncbi:PLP-dependent aminotransferase family protein [Pararhizobium sp.]|uniref:MocR-like pyridoxine biosynthesis transcription factor PdxR n=1 Tax=Pararhizobium sp. TaxID=1977563 RepID=UPI003D13D354
MADSYLPPVSREGHVSLTQQIFQGLRSVILNGTLQQGARLSSWQDLSSQLGVSRGTVKRAYDLLKDENLVETKGSGGTWVAAVLPLSPPPQVAEESKPEGLFYDFEAGPQYFQLGVPAQDEFPAKAWYGAWRQAIATEIVRPQIYPDPRGLASLRREVAGYLATARGVHCLPSQVFITSGFTGALGIVLNVMNLSGKKAFVEEPGFPRTRHALEQAGIETIPAPVDDRGMRIPVEELQAGVDFAIVTPGQQAPLGMTLSPARRQALLKWADDSDAWIIEDDYAGELQLSGHVSQALAADDASGRVFHIGSFSKTLNPGLRLGFLVVPRTLAEKFTAFVGHLAPAGSVVAQQAVQNFMSGGHFFRHLRRMKAVYADRKTVLVETLRRELHPAIRCEFDGALSVRLFLPPGTDDVSIAGVARANDLGVLPLSPWYQRKDSPRGLLLGIANVRRRDVASRCKALSQILSP